MIPLTYHNDLGRAADAKGRCALMAEFAANGAKHLVLTDDLILQVCRTPTLYQTLQAEMAASGLDFVDSHAPFSELCNLAIPDAGLRQYMIDRQRLSLRIIHDFGVRTATMHVGRLFYENCTLADYRDAIRRSLDGLLPIAEELGVVIAVENIMRPLNTTDFLLQLKAEYPTDCLGFCYDAGHANIMQTGREQEGSQPYGNWEGWGDIQWETDVLTAMRPQIVNCHLHDNTGFHDDHLMPGLGTVDWPTVLAGLKQAPRLTSVQSEVICAKHGYSVRKVCETMSALTAGLCE